jgi:hypothetical protein
MPTTMIAASPASYRRRQQSGATSVAGERSLRETCVHDQHPAVADESEKRLGAGHNGRIDQSVTAPPELPRPLNDSAYRPTRIDAVRLRSRSVARRPLIHSAGVPGTMVNSWWYRRNVVIVVHV